MTDRDSMAVLIVYYSGTGNTRFACEAVRRVLESAGNTVTMKTYAEADPRELQGYDFYCFGAPVYEWAPAINVERFVARMHELPGKPAIVVTTSAGMIGQANNLLARMLEGKGLEVLGDFNLVCPDSWGGTRRWSYRVDDRMPRTEDIKALGDFTGRVARVAGDRLERQKYDRREYRVRKSGLYWASRVSRMAPRPWLKMGRKTVDRSSCTNCGLCAEGCPAEAISLDPYPLFSDDCISCWRCVNTCPSDSITCTLDSGRHYKGIARKEERLRDAGL